MDLVGHLPRSQGYTYLRMCVHHFSHWPEDIPLTSITTETVSHVLLSEWVAPFGVPTALTSDGGSKLESGLWYQLMTLLVIHHTQTTSYHPWNGGKVPSSAQSSTVGPHQQHTVTRPPTSDFWHSCSSLKINLKCAHQGRDGFWHHYPPSVWFLLLLTHFSRKGTRPIATIQC